MESWHYNYFDGGVSIISEMVSLLDEGRVLLIYTDSDCFEVTSANDIEIGERAMMIGSEDVVCFINTDKITHLELHRSTKNKQHISALNVSEEEQ